MAFDIGDLVRCTGTFTDSDDDPLDPGTVVFKLRPPDGMIKTYTYGVDSEVVKESAGVYYVDVSIDTAGMWLYRFHSTGTGQAAEESSFRVTESSFRL